MTEARHVRFYISELAEALEAYQKLKAPSISEALTYYYRWAMARGWHLKSAGGTATRPRVWLARQERSSQLEVQSVDTLYDVVWISEDAHGSPDFLESHSVAGLLATVIEGLEDRGWVLDPDRDGYAREGGYIAGQVLAQVPIKHPFDPADPQSVQAAVDALEARGKL